MHVQQMLRDIEQKNQQMRTEWIKVLAIVIAATAALSRSFGAWIGYTLRGSH